MRTNSILAVAGVLILLAAAFAVIPIEEADVTDISAKLIGEKIQSVEYEESATYDILVRNEGDHAKNLDLSVVDLPKYWSASLSNELFSVAAKDFTIITLTVNAPSADSASYEDLDTIANIGVRGENITIGTVTIISGTVIKEREGKVVTDGDLVSGDFLSSPACSQVELKIDCTILIIQLCNRDVRFLQLIEAGPLYFIDIGPIDDAKPSSITLTRYADPDCTRADGTRADAESSTLDFTQNGTLLAQIPETEYLSVFTLFPDQQDTLIFSSYYGASGSTIDVFKGDIDVISDQNTVSVSEYERVTVERTKNIPDPQIVDWIKVTVKGNDNVEASLISNGKNVTSSDDAFYFQVADEGIFFMPANQPNPKLEITGSKAGSYSVEIEYIKGNLRKTWMINTECTKSTDDVFLLDDDMIEISKMDSDKTYDLDITYEDTAKGEKKEFGIDDVKTSDDMQSFEVKDWDKLDDTAEKPVKMTQGDSEVYLTTDMDGDDIEKEIKDAEDDDEVSIWPWVGAIIVLIFIILVGGYYFIYGMENEGDIQIETVSIDPEEPNVDETTVIRVVIKNINQTLKAEKHEVSVSFYDNYTTIEDKPIDLSHDFESSEIREVVCEWTPESPGLHTINVAVDINDTESDVNTKNIDVRAIEEE